MTEVVDVGGVSIGAGRPLALIAGPCVLETEATVMAVAEELARIRDSRRLGVVFKASFEKDNRSRVDGYRGVGLSAGLSMLAKVRERFGLPILSDVHREGDVRAAAEVLDVVQVPAFLCQQTSLLLEVGRWARVANVKKGQFIAPEDAAHAVDKVRAGGCSRVLVTERGTCFGYHRLVADMTAIPVLKRTGCPVVFDAGHVVRNYGIASSVAAGGRPDEIPTLCRCGVAAGADALFLETHPRPREALCDAASQWPLGDLDSLLGAVLPIAACVRETR